MINIDYLEKFNVTVVAEDSVMHASPYLGQHGISLYVEAFKNGYKKNILMDVGQNPDALLYNMSKMNIDPKSIDMIVLSHCHYDHTQGVSRILKETGKNDLPVIAHPKIFRLNFRADPFLSHRGVVNSDSIEKIRENGGTLFLTDEPLQLMPGLTTTGYVKRQTGFEEVGMALKTISEEGKILNDEMEDDISLVANVKDKGLVILTGCSHAGIVNITKQASEIFETNKIKAIIGGLHLIEASLERTIKTVNALYDLNVENIYGGHCTGFNAQFELRKKFNDRFVPLRTGMKFEF